MERICLEVAYAHFPDRMTDQAVYFALRKRARQARVRDFSPHDLLRTFASEMAGRGGEEEGGFALNLNNKFPIISEKFPLSTYQGFILQKNRYISSGFVSIKPSFNWHNSCVKIWESSTK